MVRAALSPVGGRKRRRVRLESAHGSLDRRQVKKQLDKVELVTNALRDALMAYEELDGPDQALVIVALFGVTQSKRLAPMLEAVAQHGQSASKATK